jgi:hypothetical protein
MSLPLGYSRLGDEHPVEGEIRGTSVHPDDAGMEPDRQRMRLEEEAALQRLHPRAWYRTEHPVEGR